MCSVLLLEMARAGGDPRLWSIHGAYVGGGGDPEQLLEEAIRLAGPATLTRAKECVARKGLLPREQLGL